VVDRSRRIGVEQELNAERKSLLSVDTAAESIVFWRNAEHFFGEAREKFAEIVDTYDGIQARHKEDVGYWQQSQTLPEGA